MTRTSDTRWLHRFALATALMTVGLIAVGGLVTSHEAGMAVPDWPTSYGYNMFLFPISKWVGGIFYEHSHRLFASGVGFLTTILAVWLWVKEPRRWVRWLGVAAFFSVVLQGVLGGLRVTLLKAQIGIFHAILAQMFLVLLCAIALFTSSWWSRLAESERRAFMLSRRLSYLLAGATCLILFQLALGATMRHQHAGLAVPDFPLAYGKVWPPMDAASLVSINQWRADVRDFGPVTAFQIGLHMTHRLTAFVILIAVGAFAWGVHRELGFQTRLARLAWGWFGLALSQLLLGILTVWSNKAADVATLHVVLGAATLVTGAILNVVVIRCSSEGLVGATERPGRSSPAVLGAARSVTSAA